MTRRRSRGAGAIDGSWLDGGDDARHGLGCSDRGHPQPTADQNEDRSDRDRRDAGRHERQATPVAVRVGASRAVVRVRSP